MNKVLQVGKYYHPARGGIETVVKNLSEGLVESGYPVSHIGYSENRRASQERIGDVNVLKIPTYGGAFSQPFSPAFPRALRRQLLGSSIVHLHSPNPMAEGLLGGLSPDTPLIVTYHSDVIRRQWLMPFYRPVLRRLLERANRIIVATPQHIEYSSALKSYGEKCVVIPFGLNPEEYTLSEEVRTFQRENLSTARPYILFIGRMVGYKGVDVLLHALQGTKISAVLIGEGPLRATYQKLAVDLGVSEQAEFRGAVPNQAELLAYLHGCETLVLPSRSVNEAFGMVLIEAMACGKPVISSRLRSGISFVNRDGISGVQVAPENPAALRAAIEGLLHNQEKKALLAKGASARFQELFTRERMVEAHARLYQEVLEEFHIRGH